MLMGFVREGEEVESALEDVEKWWSHVEADGCGLK